MRIKFIRYSVGFVAVCASFSMSCVYLDHNFREVESGALYRSGQMPDHRLGRFVNEHGIRTVVNLRGASSGEAWYDDEIALCSALDVDHHDLDWSMERLPAPASLAKLVQILESADGPVLVHCHGGTHRAAIASASFRLLNGQSVEDARDEIGLFFNDAPIGELLDLYEEDGGDFGEWVVKRYPAVYDNLNRQDAESAK